MTAPNETGPQIDPVASSVWCGCGETSCGFHRGLAAMSGEDPQPAANMSESPTGTEAEVCADIALRQAKGIAKYGQTVAENPLALSQWLQHAYEESLDESVYLKRAIGKVLDLERELAEARERLARLPADWTQDSSLETWFPYTAEELKGYRALKDSYQRLERRYAAQAEEIERLRGVLEGLLDAEPGAVNEWERSLDQWNAAIEAAREALAPQNPAGDGV